MLQEMTQFLKTRQKANLIMAAVNVIVFIVLSILGDTQSAAFMETHGAAWTPAILAGGYYRLFTSMFLHFGIVHLLYNMLCLITLGDELERLTGPVRYLIIYFGAGLAGNLLSLAWEMHMDEYAISAGASGAIFGVIGALFVIMLRLGVRSGRMSAKRLGVVALLMIAQGFFEPGTDNIAHIGGFLGGMLLAFILCRRVHEN